MQFFLITIFILSAQVSDSAYNISLNDEEIKSRIDSLKIQIDLERRVLFDLHAEIDEMRMALVSPPTIEAADELYLKGALGWAKYTYLGVYEYFAYSDSLKARALYMYIVISYQQGRYQECINRCDEFLMRFPLGEFRDNIYMISALGYFSLAQFDKTRQMASRVSGSSEHFPFSLYLTSVSYYQENRTAEGIERAREGLNNMLYGTYSQYVSDKWKGKVLITLAQLLYEQGLYSQSYEHFIMAKERGVDKDIADLGIVWIYLRVELADEAIELLEDLQRRISAEDLDTDIELAFAAAYLQKGDYNRTFNIYNDVLKEHSYGLDYENIEIGSFQEPISSIIAEDLDATKAILDNIDNLITLALIKGRYDVVDSLENVKDVILLHDDAIRSIGLRVYTTGHLDLTMMKTSILANVNDERAHVEELLTEVTYLRRRLPPGEITKLDSLKLELTSISLILADMESEIGKGGLTERAQWVMQAKYGVGLSYFMQFKDIESRLADIRLRKNELRIELDSTSSSQINENE